LAKGDIADGHTLKIWDDERRVSLIELRGDAN
jgi:hypothetical protein